MPRTRQPSLYLEPVDPMTAVLLCNTAELREEAARDAFGDWKSGRQRMDDFELRKRLTDLARLEARGWIGKREITEPEIAAFTR